MLVPGAEVRRRPAEVAATTVAASAGSRGLRIGSGHARPRSRPRRRRPVPRRSRSRKSWIRRPPRRSAGSFCPRSSAVATRSDSTCGRPRTWMSRGWRSWPRSRGMSPSTAVRAPSWRGCPRRWRRCSASRAWVSRTAFALARRQRPSERWELQCGRVRDPGPRTPDGSRTGPPLAGEARRRHRRPRADRPLPEDRPLTQRGRGLPRVHGHSHAGQRDRDRPGSDAERGRPGSRRGRRAAPRGTRPPRDARG